MPRSAHRSAILHCLDDPAEHGLAAVQYFADGALIIEDGHVAAVGEASQLLGDWREAVTEHHHCLLVPGMIDAHIHYPQCEITAAYGAQLLDWLTRHTYPTEMRFASRQHAEKIAAFFIDELLRNGTTTAQVFATVHAHSVDALFAEARAHNLRMICGKVLMDRNAPPALCDTPQRAMQESAALIKRWHNRARLGYAITPRFAPTSSPEQLHLAGQLLDEHPDVHLHTHLAETESECKWVGELFPQRRDYLDVYDHYGLLGRRSLFAHGVQLTAREWSRLAQSDSNLAFCPTSNLFIGSGLFALHTADEHRVRVGLGSDIGGGDSFSMLRVINEAYKVCQLHQRNLSPARALYLSTLGGARALDLQRVIGNFEVGKEADFITLNYRATPLLALRADAGVDVNAAARVDVDTDVDADVFDKLFALQMLGDDRAIDGVWIMGRAVRRQNPARDNQTRCESSA